MQTLVICTSPTDVSIAREIRSYIEANCSWISIEENVTAAGPGQTLEAVERALSSDIVLLLLSPDLIPSPWLRSQWEPVLVDEARRLGTRVAYALVRPCRYPEIFERQRFFRLNADARRAGVRKVREWLLDQNPLNGERAENLPQESGKHDEVMVSKLEQAVLDAPGSLCGVPREAALSFAQEHRRAFEGVFWIECLGRTLAGVLGDTANSLGLKLRSTVAQNALALREFCARRRCLFLFDALAAEHQECVAFGGLASVIVTCNRAPDADALTLDETVKLFVRWRGNPATCLQRLRVAQRYFSTGTGRAVKDLGPALFGLLRHEERFAEAYEVAEALSQRAWDEGNKQDLEHWDSEKRWIRESWDLPHSPVVCLVSNNEPVQMGFDFAG